MAEQWNQLTAKTPTSIGEIGITLYDVDGQAANHLAKYTVKILDQNGDVLKQISGNLKPHLTTAQTTAIVSFLSDMRAKAVSEILP